MTRYEAAVNFTLIPFFLVISLSGMQAVRRTLATAVFILSFAPAQPSLGQEALNTFRDCAQCPQMVVIPAGRFLMGAAVGEEEREGVSGESRGRSQPQVEMSIASFALGRYEITRGEFAAFVADARYTVGGGCYGMNDKGEYELDPRRNWRNPGFEQSDQHPVVCVNWNDAVNYIDWLSRKTGKQYRLASEAEWEYAARAGSAATRPWGGTSAEACTHANVGDEAAKSFYNAEDTHACYDGFVHTAPVGSFPANRFGVYDMIGNVWEWTLDCWNGNLEGIPTNGAARVQGDCQTRVSRGGSWSSPPSATRAAGREADDKSNRVDIVGFRVVRVL